MHARLEPMLIYLNLIAAHFSNAISSEVPGLIDFKYYVKHPGESLDQSYGNCADSAICPFLPIVSLPFSGHFSNTISSEVCGPIDFTFHVRHPGKGLY